MESKPTLSERFSASLGTTVFGAPVSFLIRLVLDLILKSSGGLSMNWVLLGIVIFALLGCLFPRTIGRKLTFWPPS